MLNYDTTVKDTAKDYEWDPTLAEIVCLGGFFLALIAAVIIPRPYLSGLWMIAYLLARIEKKLK